MPHSQSRPFQKQLFLPARQLFHGPLQMLLLLLVCFWQSSSLEGQTGEGTLENKIKITSIKSTAKGSGYVVNLRAKVKDIPTGTKIQFKLTWMSQSLSTFTHVVKGSNIDAVFDLKEVPLTQSKFEFVTVIDGKKQSGKVKAKLKKDAKKFPPRQDPWTEYHRYYTFKLGDSEALNVELAYIREFFSTRLKSLGATRKAIEAAAAKATSGEDFVKKDLFDAKKWRRFLDAELKKLRALQRELDVVTKSVRFRPYRGEIYMLREVSGIAAAHVLKMSELLYKEKDLKPSAIDLNKENPKLYLVKGRDFEFLKNMAKALRKRLPTPAATVKKKGS